MRENEYRSRDTFQELSFSRGIVLQSDSWQRDNVSHGFIGSGLDFREAPTAWKEFQPSLPNSSPLILAKQTHSTTVITVTPEMVLPHNSRVAFVGEGDALFAQRSLSSHFHPCFGVLTADCFPVLIRSRKIGAVAVVHSGWRGAVGGILLRTIERFTAAASDANSLEVLIGPGAQPCCYEIKEDLERELRAATTEKFQSSVIQNRRGKIYGSVQTVLLSQLYSCRVPTENIQTCDRCTICSEAFYSFRRDRELAGRQLSFVTL